MRAEKSNPKIGPKYVNAIKIKPQSTKKYNRYLINRNMFYAFPWGPVFAYSVCVTIAPLTAQGK